MPNFAIGFEMGVRQDGSNWVDLRTLCRLARWTKRRSVHLRHYFLFGKCKLFRFLNGSALQVFVQSAVGSVIRYQRSWSLNGAWSTTPSLPFISFHLFSVVCQNNEFLTWQTFTSFWLGIILLSWKKSVDVESMEGADSSWDLFCMGLATWSIFSNGLFYMLLLSISRRVNTALHWLLCNASIAALGNGVVIVCGLLVRRAAIDNMNQMMGKFSFDKIKAYNQPYHVARDCLAVRFPLFPIRTSLYIRVDCGYWRYSVPALENTALHGPYRGASSYD